MANLGFNPLVDPATQQNIDQQYKFADLLRQESMTPDQGQMIGNYYVAPSATQRLAKLLQAYSSGQIRENANKLQQTQWQNQLDMLRSMAGVGDGSTAGISALQQGANALPNDANNVNQGGVGPTVQNASLQNQMTPKDQGGGGGIYNIPGMSPQQKMAFLLMGNGDKLAEASLKQYEPTDLQKNSAWMGRTPQEVAAETRGAAQKAATLEMQPGSTSLNLITGQRQTAPDFKTGLNFQYDNAGNPSIGLMPGSENIAALEGQKASATEGAKAGYDMVTVDMGDGSTQQMPRSEAIKLTAAQAGSQSPPVNITPEIAANNKAAIQSLMQQEAQLRASGNTQGADLVHQALVHVQTQLANTPIVRTDGTATNTPPIVGRKPSAAQLKQDETISGATGTAAVDAAKIEAQAEPLLNIIKQAREINSNVPYGGFGIAEGKAAFSKIPGVDHTASGNAALWDQLTGQSILSTIANLAAGGGIRMDIPIVKEIQKAGGIPMDLAPSERARMLDQLESEVRSRVAASKNTVSNLNKPNIAKDTTQTPMASNNAASGWAIKKVR